MLIVFAIAAGAVGREAHLLDAVPARPVFDPDEATTWIAEHLPPQTTAAMSYAEVGLVVNATLDLLRSNAGVAATSGEVPDAGGETVVDENETVNHAMQAANAAGMRLDPADVSAVVAALFAYLEVIGAVGPVKES
jgi:hypothetical protein